MLLKIESFQEKTQSENIVDYIKINYIQKAFTLRLNNDEEIIQNAMLSYNGVKGIQIKFDTPDFYHDKYIFSFHECWDKIRWGKNENKIKEGLILLMLKLKEKIQLLQPVILLFLKSNKK